jgi:hypothetical protein
VPARAFALLVAAAVLAAAVRARAEPPACPDAPPADDEVRERLTWIERRIDENEDDVRRWFTAFVVLHGALAGANATIAISTPDDPQRIDMTVNTISSTLGMLTLLGAFPPILGAGDSVRGLPRATAEERLRALRVAESLLRRSADASSFVRSEGASLLSAGYVTAASLTLLFLERPAAAVVHAIGGALLGQGRLLLHPAGIVGAWKRYFARYPDAGCEPPSSVAPEGLRLAVAPALGPGHAGVALGVRF